MTEAIIISAYPKSGSTWLARTIGDALNSPVDGVADAIPLAREGQERKGNYTVYQTHLAAHHMGQEYGLVHDRFQFNLDRYDSSKHIVIHLVRDPRAIAVSAKYYWEIPSVGETLDAMHDANSPIEYSYPIFVQDWIDSGVYQVKYEDLLDNPEAVLLCLFDYFNIPYSIRRVRRAIAQQEFTTRKKELEASGDKYPYSCGIQSHNLRSGTKDEWRQHFNSSLNDKAVRYFGDIMTQLDYPLEDEGWESALLKMKEIFTILPDAGLRKAQVLYELSRSATSGALVELGVYQGKGVIAMALGTQESGRNLPVYAVDDYQDHLDWANNQYSESNLSILQSNIDKVGLGINIIRSNAGHLMDMDFYPIALWCWDISTTAEDLWQHWSIWNGYIQKDGIAFIRDLYDKRFDSDRVKQHALGHGFVVESEELGILLLRKV